MTNEDLAKRDYILLVDKSGSMTGDAGDGTTRWNKAKEMTMALASKCAEFDSDGITVIPFSSTHKEYKNVKDGIKDVEKIWKEQSPLGGTNLHDVLEHVFTDYFKSPTKPITVLVVTDGEPDGGTAGQKKVANLIINTTKKMTADEQIGVSFIQVGQDPSARTFLKYLDDNLVPDGAKFDIVDTKTFEEIEKIGNITDVLIAALED